MQSETTPRIQISPGRRERVGTVRLIDGSPLASTTRAPRQTARPTIPFPPPVTPPVSQTTPTPPESQPIGVRPQFGVNFLLLAESGEESPGRTANPGIRARPSSSRGGGATPVDYGMMRKAETLAVVTLAVVVATRMA